MKINSSLLENPEVLNVHKKLYLIDRTGWVLRGVKNPENVGEHTDGIIELAERWHKELEIENVDHLRDIILVHDWPEIICGDLITYTYTGEEYEKVATEKASKESAAIITLCEPLGKDGEVILKLWREYSDKATPIAFIAWQLDKLQSTMRALEYERRGEKVSTLEFIEDKRSRNQIVHPFLVKVFEKIEQEAKQLQNTMK